MSPSIDSEVVAVAKRRRLTKADKRRLVLLIADDDIKKLILERARVAEIFSARVEGGMLTLKMDGMEKIMIALTDIKMVRAVASSDAGGSTKMSVSELMALKTSPTL